MTIKNYIASGQANTSIITGLVIAAMALIGASRHPLFYAIVGLGWAATTIVGYTVAQRRA